MTSDATNLWVRQFDVIVREASWQAINAWHSKEWFAGPDAFISRVVWAAVPRYLAVAAAQHVLAQAQR